MRAAFIVDTKKIEIRDVPMPTYTDDEMLVKVEACGVCTSDMASFLNSYSEEMKKRMPMPRRVGHEPAGTVVEVGKNVKNFKVGDRVTGIFGDGCFAEYVVCAPNDKEMRGHGVIVGKIPDGIPIEHAIGEPMMCLTSIARTTQPEFGDTIFQAGAGFMGLGVIAAVASPLVKEYIVADLEDWRLDLAKKMGATITLNPKKCDVVEEVMKITEGKGVDISIEVVGHPPTMKMVGDVLKTNRGKIIAVGWHQAPDTYELQSWIKSPIIYSPQGIGMSTDFQSELTRALWAIKNNIFPMKQLVTHTYTLDQMNEAFNDNLGRTPGYIKGVVMPWKK